MMKQYLLTAEMGKSLIAYALSKDEGLIKTAKEHTLVILAGTTNAYLAKYLLDDLESGADFNPVGFRRGVNTAPGEKAPVGPYSNRDVVIIRGQWQREKTIFDVAGDLSQGDTVIKGANAIQPDRKVAGVQIGHPQFGTMAPILQSVMGKRVRLIIPVGLEKRVLTPIADLAALVNAPDGTGPRLQPVIGDIVTEIEAMDMLYGVKATLLAAGGIGTAVGSCTFLVQGEERQLAALDDTVRQLMII